MKYNHDVEITTKKSEGHHDEDSETHTHPCFGLVSIHRVTGDRQGLFGTELEMSNTIRLTIQEAQVTQDLAHHWYFGKNELIEIEMSPVQYAELISNPNTQGTPCTIRYRNDLGSIAYKSIDTLTQHIESRLDKKLGEYAQNAEDDLQKILDVLNKPKALNKSDRGEIYTLVNTMKSRLVSSVPFHVQSAFGSINKAKAEAKAEVDSFITHAITKAGVKALQDPEALKLLLEDRAREAEGND